MTEEDKQLLLIDICARLPYGLQIHIINDEYDEGFQSGEFDNTLRYHHLEAFVCDRIEVKPYLRSISSMTVEEWEQYNKVLGDGVMVPLASELDWLNAHHFDYRGLIEKGLALEAPEEMYKDS